jgi:alpha-beta hydrolase superfamily lysophospholipase
LIVALVALTSACAPLVAREGIEMRMPAIEKVEQMGISGDRYITRDGLKLGLMSWEADMPKAVIIGLHGMNDYSNAFSMPAPWWAAHGITTYAYDQRGFGRSPNAGIWGGNDLMRRDLVDFVDIVRARHPGLPVYVLGESMGGALAMSAFGSAEPPKADGLILIAPAVWSRKTMPFSYRLALWMTSHTFRAASFNGSGLKIMPSDNIEMLRANGHDPLFLKQTRSDAIYGLVNLMDEGYASASHLNHGPLLFMYGGRDQIIPKAPTETVVKELSSNATVKNYPTGYHMLLRDLNAQPRWADLAAWIDAHNAGGMAAAAE